MTENIKRLEGENEESFIWRVGSAVDAGKMTWAEATDILNKYCRDDDVAYQEATYRKPYKNAKRFYEAGVFSEYSGDSYIQELEATKEEIRKERIKLSDARVDYNKIIRREARKETYVEMVKGVICDTVEPIQLDIQAPKFTSDNDLICHFTDIHAGIEIDQWKNKYNEDILKQRAEKYVENVLEIQKRHNSQKCYLIVGELVSGIIHNNLRMQNNLDLMEQFKLACEIIAAMVTEFSKVFEGVYVFTTPGNHSRISPKKEDALDGENMDVLLPFYMTARMQNFDNVFICPNTIDPGIAMFTVRGNKVFATHGDKDSPSNVVQNLTMIFGMKPDIVLLGHRHTNAMETVYDTKVIQSGCVSGTDNYAMSLRKSNRPEQTASVVSENGLVCLYDIQVD